MSAHPISDTVVEYSNPPVQTTKMDWNPAFFLEWVLSHPKKLAFLSWFAVLYTIAATMAFSDNMSATITKDDQAAYKEAGVYAALIMSDIVLACLAVQFTSIIFFKIHVSASVRGSGVRPLRNSGDESTVPEVLPMSGNPITTSDGGMTDVAIRV